MSKRLISIHSVLVVAIVLLAVFIPSCTGEGETYDLTMEVAPPFSGTATDVTGGSPYEALTTVQIQAAANGSYTFCEWTSSAGGLFTDPNDPNTTFIMPANDVIVTANFVGPLDHFKCYDVDYQTAPYPNREVQLEDQFGAINVTVEKAVAFANPTDKVQGLEETLRWNLNHHITFYNIDYQDEPGTWYVQVDNQFGTYNLTVEGPTYLGVPTQKVEPGNHTKPLCLDHFLVYDVINGPVIGATVDLKDEFGTDPYVGVGQIYMFANPAKKTDGSTVTPIKNPDDHLVFCDISGTEASYQQVQVSNQFDADQQTLQTLNLEGPSDILAVPSKKLDWGEQLDHFKGYLAWDYDEEPVNATVSLKDQFVDIEATVMWSTDLCNPTEKNGELIVDDNHHLTIYTLEDVVPDLWSVVVSNQFDDMGEPQYLYVTGPVALAVPTQKEGHQMPQDLDHYLLYSVVGGTPVNILVSLTDQFSYPDNEYVTVAEPVFFANPVQKTPEGGTPTTIKNSMAHLVFYKITGGVVSHAPLTINNQFGGQTLIVGLPDILGVPSMKLWFNWGWPG